MFAKLARAVVTVDIDPEMSQSAEKRLHAMHALNVTYKVGDGAQGWTEDGPFDIICIHGSVKNLAEVFKQTLNLHGRLFVVTGDKPAMSATLITRLTESEWQSKVLFETVAPRLVHGEPKPEFEF
jgi:protein-L-isoaspartate(D-aspartate) O-methyltransferase